MMDNLWVGSDTSSAWRVGSDLAGDGISRVGLYLNRWSQVVFNSFELRRVGDYNVISYFVTRTGY